MRFVPAPPRHDGPPDPPPAAPAPTGPLGDVLGASLTRGRVHEVYAAEGDDIAAAAGFAAAVALCLGRPGQAVVWLRSRRAAQACGVLQGPGWAQWGGGHDDMLVGAPGDAPSLLRAAHDALRCPALGAVVVEGWGAMRELDLTASRRFALAAEKSGVPLLLLRIDAAPVPSAAHTRWQVAAAPSRALPGHAPGLPAFDVTLLRQRGGPCGLAWRLEWDRDQRIFGQAPLSGAVVPVSAGRPAAPARSARPLRHQRNAA